MSSAVIVAYGRSPFTFATKGDLAKIRGDDLLAQVIEGVLKKLSFNHNDIEDLILGCAFPEGEQGLNMARLVALHSGLPLSVAGVTLNRFCGSSMESIHRAVGAIATGCGDIFICAGVESMSRVPMGGYNPMPNPVLYENTPGAYMGMGETAENVSKRYGISRQDQEEMAVQSHQKAHHAQENSLFKDEIIPIKVRQNVVSQDGCIRPGTSMEGLAALKPAFDINGVVTAGTSSPLTDGASVVIVASEDYARAHNLPILCRIKSMAVAGCDPEIMGIGPVHATQKALNRAGLTIHDMDIVELNEAFAAQGLACIKELNINPSSINLDGGALALGHPLGATGARITGKVASLLVREKKRYGLATQCIGGGQGIATIVERVV
jgi:acetyl-CoA acyltransferase